MYLITMVACIQVLSILLALSVVLAWKHEDQSKGKSKGVARCENVTGGGVNIYMSDR